MARVRWFSAKWALSLRAIGAKMKADAFNDRSGRGFLVERLRDGLIEGEYIEKREVEEVSVDPFGNEQRSNAIEYRRVNFRLSNEFPEIQISKSPRNIQSFVSRLVELNKFEFAIMPLEVDVVRWGRAVAESGKYEVDFTAMQAGEIAFGDGVTGKVFLRGENIQTVMKELLKGKRHTIERIVMTVASGQRRTSFQLCKDGAVSIGAVPREGFMEQVRDSLKLSMDR